MLARSAGGVGLAGQRRTAARKRARDLLGDALLGGRGGGRRDLIPASYAERSAADLQKLEALATHAALNSTETLGKTSMAGVLGALSVGNGGAGTLHQALRERHGRRPGELLDRSRQRRVFSEPEVATLRFGVLTGRLTRGYLPLIEELAAQRNTGQIRGRAISRDSRARSGWRCSKSRRPTASRSASHLHRPRRHRARARNLRDHARALLHPDLPDDRLLGAGHRGRRRLRRGCGATAEFLDANPALDLRYTNVDAYAAKTELAPEVARPYWSAQRLIKINSDYTVMSALLADGITRRSRSTQWGRAVLSRVLDASRAWARPKLARTWGAAEQTHPRLARDGAQVQHLARHRFTYHDRQDPPRKGQRKGGRVPDLQTLFGSESLCECEECQSVLGDGRLPDRILDSSASAARAASRRQAAKKASAVGS